MSLPRITLGLLDTRVRFQEFPEITGQEQWFEMESLFACLLDVKVVFQK